MTITLLFYSPFPQCRTKGKKMSMHVVHLQTFLLRAYLPWPPVVYRGFISSLTPGSIDLYADYITVGGRL